jgi:FkbM family methyltransferase
VNVLLRSIKEAVERITGARIYRHTLPHGADCFYDLAKRFERNDFRTVFDVGANVGQSALTYLREFPQAEIYCFEPVANTYQSLISATRRYPRIHTYNLGMGSESGDMIINVSPYSEASSIGLKRPEDHAEPIRIETIAGFAKKHKIDRIDFLKVDTEGYDLDVLSGAAPLLREQRIHFVQSECEPTGRTQNFVDFASLAQFMAGHGYQVFAVYEQQPEWDGRNELLYWNALFICESLVAQGAKLPAESGS